MKDYAIYSPESFRLCPWKNGLGTTRELYAAYGEDQNNYLWRISMAGVVQDGPFSDFPGYDRVLVLLEGHGMTMECRGEETVQQIALKKPLDMAFFSGDWKTSATLTQGKVSDFNVITQRQHCHAKVDIFRAPEPALLPSGGTNLVAYLPFGEGKLISCHKEEQTLPRGHLLHITSSETWLLQCAEAIVARIFLKESSCEGSA